MSNVHVELIQEASNLKTSAVLNREVFYSLLKESGVKYEIVKPTIGLNTHNVFVYGAGCDYVLVVNDLH